jgi:hypothetical protein
MEKTGLLTSVPPDPDFAPAGGPGGMRHEVERQTGFSVVYGPVRAKDLGAFLEGGLTATREQCAAVSFSLWDRLGSHPGGSSPTPRRPSS